MKKYFAVADTHSFYGQLVHTLRDSGFDKMNSDHIVIICGDAFDRGDFSLEMFEWMKQMVEDNRLIYIRGNHEDLLEDCVHSILRRQDIESHHISNGTINTIADLVGCSKYDILCYTFDWKTFEFKMNEVLEFIKKHSVDYFELGNTIFVHGWVPTTIDENNVEIVHSNFRDGDWRKSRWSNGMDSWIQGITIPEKTIVCGHWSTSYAWCIFEKQCEREFGPGSIFNTYVKNGIVALDACTAYSMQMNCAVFDDTGKLISY